MALYTYPAKVGRYYSRRRVVNGVRGTLLPYTTGTFKHYCKGPRGGKALKECYRQTWWADGRVCSIKSVCYEEPSDEAPKGKWRKEFVPLSGEVYNRYDTSEPHYKLYEGVLMTTLAVGVDGFGNLY